MLLDLLPLLLAALVGLHLQGRTNGERLRARLWQANYVLVLPVAACYAFLSIDVDSRLVAAVACSLTAWWLTVGVSFLYARAVSTTPPMLGALTFIGAFPNTGFIGYPLAYLAFGADGLRLAVIYDQVNLVVPSIVVATVFARVLGERDDSPPVAGEQQRSTFAIARRQVLLSPPLWTVIVLIALRATVLHEPIQLDTLGTVVGGIVGPIGFLLLGLSIPLHGFDHDRREAAATIGASAVRLLVAPLLVAAMALATGTHVPGVLYLCAALPTAFHALVIARLYDLEPAVVRLGVVTTTVTSVTAIVAWVALR